MQGYLEMWHGFFSRWSKYYFRIHEQTLLFGPKKQQIEGKIHLKVAQIISMVDDPITFIIHTGTDTLRLRANSIDERVKWFKKLKKIQKDIEQENYAKQISSMNGQRGKGTKSKMLESIVVELWQSHAELQNQIDQISLRFKTLPNVKSLTDKLRMTVQFIKLKSSEALKIIEEYSRSSHKNRDVNMNRNRKDFFEQIFDDNYSEKSQSMDGTQFMSFDNDRNGMFNKISKKRSDDVFGSNSEINLKDFPHSGRRNYIDQSNNYESSSVSSYRIQTPIRMVASGSSGRIKVQNYLKQKLLDTNPVFIEFKKNITNNKKRAILPQKFTPEQKFPMGSVLKGSIGSDLTKLSLPVSINQPISMLQKTCEQMYYSRLLDQANQQQTPQRRMLYVASFLISQYSLSDLRTKKPFNSLLGETFEFYDEQRQFSLIAEQVSHHPPISAMYCRSDTFQMFDQTQVKTNFTGQSIKGMPEGKSKLRLEKHPSQFYKFTRCTISLNNLVVGKTSLDISGELKIQCQATSTSCSIIFQQNGFFGKSSPRQIEGEIKSNGSNCYSISGKWNQYVKATDLRDKTTITTWTRKHVSNKDYYYFNEYTMLMNHLNKQSLAQIAPTDSRLRPDQRALQYQNLDLASSEKLRLEEKQRLKRKQNQKFKIGHKIKWFVLDKDPQGDEIYVSNHVYETERGRGDWADFPDIY